VLGFGAVDAPDRVAFTPAFDEEAST